MIAVHGRTRCQMYNGAADWHQVGVVVDAVDVPVVVNGDINSLDAVSAAIDASNAAGVMITVGPKGVLAGWSGWRFVGRPNAATGARHTDAPPAYASSSR